MKQVLRRYVERLPAPLPVLTQDAFRYVRYAKIRKEGRIRREILRKTQWSGEIAQGPFRGMRYSLNSYGSTILPKLFGTYESELAPTIEAIAVSGCDKIVDIGAAEGYYAVGLALRVPEIPLVGFEMSSSARYYLRRLIRLNGVEDRIEIRGECNADSLAEVLEWPERPVVICDCEGAEDFLLDPERVPALQRSWILVETHDDIVAGVSERLRERFHETHDIEVIRNQPRTRADLPAGFDFSAEEVAEAVEEYRSWAEWLFMRPKASEKSAREPKASIGS